MAPPNREHEVLSSHNGEDIPLGVFAAHVGTSRNRVGPIYVYLWCVPQQTGLNEAYAAGHGRDVFGLHSGLVRAEYPTEETPQLAATFINQFLRVKGDFPIDFRLLGWVHSSEKSWWDKMVGFILTELEDSLKQVGLYQAVRAIQYGIP